MRAGPRILDRAISEIDFCSNISSGCLRKRLEFFLSIATYPSPWYWQLNWPSLLELGYEYLQATQISTRHHFLACLALLSIQPQPSRYRRSPV